MGWDGVDWWLVLCAVGSEVGEVVLGAGYLLHAVRVGELIGRYSSNH